MRCKQFQSRMPDWVAGRLPADQTSKMEAHHAMCRTCQQAAAAEQALRQRWSDLPAAPDVETVWPRLAQRISGLPQRRRFPLFQALAMSSLAATACLCLLFLRPHSASDGSVQPPRQDVNASIDDTRIVQMASQIQQTAEGESDAFFAETQQDRSELHRVLSGGKGK